MVEYEKDDIDYMLLYYIQFVQRLVGKSVSNTPPPNWRDEVEVIEDMEYIDLEEYEELEDELIDDFEENDENVE